MTAHQPPVPPAGRSPKGPGGNAQAGVSQSGIAPPQDPKTAQQVRQAAIKQNTTHKGLQQDR